MCTLSETLTTRFDIELAINLVLPLTCSLLGLVFLDIVISSSFLSILVTSFPIGTEKVRYFSVFFPKQLNFPSHLSAISFIIK